MLTLLYDGDILLYKACYSCASSGENVKDYMRSYVDFCVDRVKADRLVMVASSDRNFRKEILPSYKENRADTAKPEGFAEAKEFLLTNWKTKVVDNLEADDVLAILATCPTMKGDRIILSVDKDFEQVPCTLINPAKDISEEGGYSPRTISEELANYNFYKQCLTGDRVDNYLGIPGVGPVKAQKILGEVGQSEKELWGKVVDAYEEAGLTEEDALQQARCARLLRYNNYDYVNKQVILWEPPSYD